MNYSLEDYETAIITTLQDLRKENGGYLAALEGYAGQLDSQERARLWVGRLPAVAVAVAGAEYPEEGRKNICYSQVATVVIFVAAHSWRGQAAARGGDTGAYALLRDLRARLHRKNLGLQIRECVIVRESIVESDLAAVVFRAEYLIINDRLTEEGP